LIQIGFVIRIFNHHQALNILLQKFQLLKAADSLEFLSVNNNVQRVEGRNKDVQDVHQEQEGGCVGPILLKHIQVKVVVN
jgi:hypothetical protein